MKPASCAASWWGRPDERRLPAAASAAPLTPFIAPVGSTRPSEENRYGHATDSVSLGSTPLHPFFTRQNVPPALLTHHNTAVGVFGQLCVMEGTVTYHGFADEQAEEPEVSLVIRAGEFATSPPQYWHRVELSEDARFNIHFWAEQAESDQPLFNSRKA